MISKRPVLSRLLPALATIVTILIAGAILIIWQQHRNDLTSVSADEIASMSREIQVDIANQAYGLALCKLPRSSSAADPLFPTQFSHSYRLAGNQAR